jgi:hypothetical protein
VVPARRYKPQTQGKLPFCPQDLDPRRFTAINALNGNRKREMRTELVRLGRRDASEIFTVRLTLIGSALTAID